MTIIYFLLLLSIIICIHEAGHLLAAKFFGVYCYEYAFGMGPAIFQKKGKETVYSIRALPIGGFVSMAGEPDGDEAYPDVVVPPGRRLTEQKRWKRIIIMLAGVTMNFLLALFLFSTIFLMNGSYVESPKPIVNSVVENSPAEKAGFQAGDVIKKISLEDGTSMTPDTFMDMTYFFLQYEGGKEYYVVERDGQTLELEVLPEYNEQEQRYMIGIVGGEGTLTKVNILNCWKYGLEEMWSITKLMFTTILRLFRGKGLDQLSGPVGIYNAAGEYAALGITAYLFLIAQLSLNVGIFNLLPLPVLDGGQVVITAVEGLIGKPLNQKFKLGLMGACWVLLIGLMVFVTWNDISRIFS